MPPNTDKQLQTSLNFFKYPTNRDVKFKTPSSWLKGKVIDDETDGLWRIHDKLYDVTDFISSHPGGSMWLEMTKGTDITEAFESHHLTSLPETMLEKYFVRKARNQRNSPFTFKEDGFYRTLKRNVKIALKDVPKDASKTTDYIIDTLCLATFMFAIVSCKIESFFFAIISAFCLTFTIIAAHNYFHRKDNFRMYYFNLCMMDFRDWRISHALSHHLFPNTIIDFEISGLEPLVSYLPVKKTILKKYISYLLVFPLWATVYISSYIKRLLDESRLFPLDKVDLVPFTLPLAMYLCSGASLVYVIGMWFFIIIVGGFIFGFIGFNAAHHHPDIFHEGDAPRSKEGIDWGMHQLDAVADRYEVTGNTFLVLVSFGDHALHHIFPTLDHNILNYLYPTFEKTMKQFGVSLHMRSQLELIAGQFQQLSKDTPNLLPPGNRSKK